LGKGDQQTHGQHYGKGERVKGKEMGLKTKQQQQSEEKS